MPLTFAHPAAVVPLKHLLGRYASLSAMVIGSMAPDVSHFLFLDVPRRTSHSWHGIVEFCLPVGMLVYIVFHTIVKRPMWELLPESISSRIDLTTMHHPNAVVHWLIVIASMLLGATTHITWDLFTHDATEAIEMIPGLATRLTTIFGYPLYVYKLLQHGSTIVGCAAILWWIREWYHETGEINAQPHRLIQTSRQRGQYVALIVVLSVVIGTWWLLHPSEMEMSDDSFPMLAKRLVVCASSAIGLAVFLFSFVWHLVQRRVR